MDEEIHDEDPGVVLGRVFNKTCVAMEKLLDKGEISAAELNVIIKLLKDNNITALPVKGKPLHSLAEKADSFDFPFAPANSSLLDTDDPAAQGPLKALEGS